MTTARQLARQQAQSTIAWPAGVRRSSGRTPANRARPRGTTTQPAKAAPADQRQRHFRGAVAEMAAVALLMLKGYRIVERRHRNRFAEIDIIAVRGRRLAFVEVKFRPSFEAAAAAISDAQAARIGDAAEQWVWRHPSYREHEIGLDAVLVGGFRLPRHVIDALQPG